MHPLHLRPRGVVIVFDSVGPSGSGKTTALRDLHQSNPGKFHILDPAQICWDADKSVVSHLNQQHYLLNSVGLNSIRSRVSNFKSLSEGQKYRVVVARLLKESLCSKHIDPDTDYCILDEFTSVLGSLCTLSLSPSLLCQFASGILSEYPSLRPAHCNRAESWFEQNDPIVRRQAIPEIVWNHPMLCPLGHHSVSSAGSRDQSV